VVTYDIGLSHFAQRGGIAPPAGGAGCLAPGVPFGEALALSAKMMTAIPREEIGRMMSGPEAAELILQLSRVVEGHGNEAMIVLAR
jgi:hypothetical protein